MKNNGVSSKGGSTVFLFWIINGKWDLISFLERTKLGGGNVEIKGGTNAEIEEKRIVVAPRSR